MDHGKEGADSVHIGEKLVAWFREYGRRLPFREDRDPYKVWIAEVIFQQTRISQGLDYYHRFLERFPEVGVLASAPPDEVMLQWKGLGYYSRAINLHSAARQIMTEFQGKFPRDYSDLLKLKGVGRYTAAAIASLAYGQPYPAVDGNLYRVLSRVFADDFDIAHAAAFHHFEKLANRMMPRHAAAEFNEGMMDLGAEICTPRAPLCIVCPLQSDCLAFNTGTVEHYPVKSKIGVKTEEHLAYFAVTYEDFILIRQRDHSGIWKSLWEFSTTLPASKFLRLSEKTVVHLLTHKRLTLQLTHAQVSSAEILDRMAKELKGVVVQLTDLGNYAFPKPLQDFISQISKNVGESSGDGAGS